MNIQLSFEVFDEYLKIILSGGNPYNDIAEILTTIKRLAEENNRQRIFIEAIDIITPSEMQKFHIGELGSGVLTSGIKVAVFSRREYVNKFMENVAVNRGAQLYVAGSKQAALSWLLK